MSPRLGAARLVAALAAACAAPLTYAQESAPAALEPRVVIEDLVQGVGRAAEPGMELVVHYTGWLYDPAPPDHHGRRFDSSRERGQPFGFLLGAGRVIPGWEIGCSGMRVGGRRRLIIPPELAYGSRGAGNGVIPADATLLFEIELLAIGIQTTGPQTE